jgi:3-hydroxyacyl-CoA dehydrogenase/enoyl-CoA hydratase/3-hydroxybutyryl-CoA epimerase
MLEEGGTIEKIDDALMQFGMPMGAFVLLDEIGIDVAYKVSGILRQGLGERVAQSSLLERLLKAGYLGRKNGKGFYMYLRGQRGGPSPLIPQMIEQRQREGKLTPEEIVDRAILLMVKEAALCLEDRIIDRPDLLDAALIFGIGFPPFRGGLLRYADSLGAQTVMQKLEALAKTAGDRFTPPASLGDMSRDALIGQIVR